MNLHFKSKQVPITDAVEQHFGKKLQRLSKQLGRDAEAFISCTRQKGQDKLEITLKAPGLEIRAEDQAGDLYAALDLVCDRLERQIAKYKTRIIDNKRNQRESIRKSPELLPVEFAPEDIEVEDDEQAPRIVRSKRFPLKPLDAEEACLQMELLGHSFYVFLNAETEQVNVVYKRKDGEYGLIEPE